MVRLLHEFAFQYDTREPGGTCPLHCEYSALIC
jgi:hypothetical protein